MKRLLLLMSALSMVFSLCGCSLNEQVYSDEYFDVFDTYVSFQAYAKNQEEFKTLSKGLHSRLQEINREFDIYNSYDGLNNIKTINDNAGIKPVKVNAEIIDLIKKGQDAYITTNGTINIAMGSVLEVWHNYREAALANPTKAKIPTQEELEKANQYTNINSIVVDETASTVYILDKGTSLDVGALAKGYAADKAKEYLVAKGVDSALLNLGGNVLGINGKLKPYWNIAVQDPDDSSKYLKTISISNESAVSSGNYQRYYDYNGKRYHHIIDPKTLFPADTNKATTVVTESSTKGDLLSTYLFILPYEEGKKAVKDENGHVLWVTADNTQYEK